MTCKPKEKDFSERAIYGYTERETAEVQRFTSGGRVLLEETGVMF